MKITRKQAEKIINLTYPDYTGRKVNLEFKEKITLYDLNWSGGTKNYYQALNVNGTMTTFNLNVMFNPLEGKQVEIDFNTLIVNHCFFCGHDMGIRIYANPQHAPKWLTA